jgi:dUTP pyrophosphatase
MRFSTSSNPQPPKFTEDHMTAYVVYSKPNCPWCVHALRLLKEFELEHTVKKIDSEYERLLLADKWKWNTFPIIVTTKGELIGGFTELKALLVKEATTAAPTGPTFEVELIDALATMPRRGSEKAAGFDLSMVSAGSSFADTFSPAFALHPGKRALFKTGLKIALPEGYYARIAPRSGLAVKQGIDVLAGVIDEDYRGEWVVILQNFGATTVEFSTGDRIAQFILTPYGTHAAVSVAQLDATARGVGGFGSTG